MNFKICINDFSDDNSFNNEIVNTANDNSITNVFHSIVPGQTPTPSPTTTEIIEPPSFDCYKLIPSSDPNTPFLLGGRASEDDYNPYALAPAINSVIPNENYDRNDPSTFCFNKDGEQLNEFGNKEFEISEINCTPSDSSDLQTSNFINSISIGKEHTLILDNNQRIYSCGSSNYNQLFSHPNKYGFTDHPDLSRFNIIQVVTGPYHSLILNDLGNVYICGYNDVGQLGIEEETTVNIRKLESISNIKMLATGKAHSLF